MPDLYALTAPKLFAVIHGILKNEDQAGRALSDVYKSIWEHRYEFSQNPTFNELLVFAKRAALDYMLAGDIIPRAGSVMRLTSVDDQSEHSTLSGTDLDLLYQVHKTLEDKKPAEMREALTPQDLRDRLISLLKDGAK